MECVTIRRKLFNAAAASGLHFAHYYFAVRHSTLKKTPAVAGGIADDRWTVEQLVESMAGYNLPKQTEWEQFLDTLPDEE